MNKLKTQLSLFFSKREQKKIIFVFFLMLLASFLELLSLGMILPITSVFLDDANSAHLNFLNNFSSLDFYSTQNLIYILLTIFFLIYLFKIAILLFITWYQQRFLYNL